MVAWPAGSCKAATSQPYQRGLYDMLLAQDGIRVQSTRPTERTQLAHPGEAEKSQVESA